VRTLAAAVLVAAAAGLGLYVYLDRNEISPPPGQTLPQRIRDPQQLVGTYTGLLDPPGVGRPVYSVLRIESVSDAIQGGASFRYTLNTGDQRQDGHGQARLESGLILLSRNELLRLSLDAENRLVLEGDSGQQLRKQLR
jgi:hypothetical protein